MNEKDFAVSTDDTLLNLPWVVAQIKAAYWGGWRSEELILKSLKSSINFGLYYAPEHPEPMRQIGFGRVVTDGCTVNWVCDIIIEEKYRASRLGTFLMENILKHPDLASGVSILSTRDAHTFYEKLGYRRVESMKRIPGKP